MNDVPMDSAQARERTDPVSGPDARSLDRLPPRTPASGG